MKKIFLFSFLIILIGCSAENHLLSISGTITISSQLASKLEPSDRLEILALSPETFSHLETEENRDKKSKREVVPIAIQKIAPVTFPLKYKISEEDVLFPENHFKGNLVIVAKIEKNSAKTAEGKKALIGSYQKNPVLVGSKNVDIVIDQEK